MSGRPPLSRADLAQAMYEVERMQARLAERNVASWVAACDQVLGTYRQWLDAAEQADPPA